MRHDRPIPSFRAAACVAIASGKGGVGKTWFAITLAHALARAGRRVLLFDGDLGLANVDIQLGLTPTRDLGSVIAGRASIAEAALRHPEGGFDILAGRSGSGALSALDPATLEQVLAALRQEAARRDIVLLDLGAGLDRATRRMAAAADTAPGDGDRGADQPHRRLCRAEAVRRRPRGRRRAGRRQPGGSRPAGERTHATLPRACATFLGHAPPLAGVIRRDDRVRDAIRRQALLLTRHPASAAAATWRPSRARCGRSIRRGPPTRRHGLPLRRPPDNRLPVMRAAAAALLILCCLPAPARGDPAAGAPVVAAVSDARCPAAASLTTPARQLDRLAAAIGAGGPVNILAVGSATTSGQDSSGDNAFPRRTIGLLREALPRVPFELTVRGGIGMPAADMLPLMEAALQQRHVELVLWQTGTVEAVHGIPSAELRAALQAGAALVRKAGADLVLIGPQFSRVLSSKADLAPYEQALRDTADLPGVVLFDRLDLTRDWVQNGRIDLERAAKGGRQAVLETLHSCVGATLARFLLTGAGQPEAR